MPPVRVRFAPSPTGFLHVGGLRTALYNYLFAKHHHGSFILRIEDTDQSRKVDGAAESLVETLRWAGIDYDEGPDVGGEYGPYVQSERLATYKEHVHTLLDAGKAYYCFCTAERLQEVRKKQQELKRDTSYDGHCRDLPAADAVRRARDGESCVIRMKVPAGGDVSFVDAVRGSVTIAHAVIDDQVLLKSDGFPTYHLAVVVDDHLMGITHVIRGEEWLPSTPKHVLLYEAFGWEVPAFAHLPLLLNPDKSKLSKRQGDVAVEAYRDQGFLPEALVNFVAFLGWNPGDERELFSMEELIHAFSLERVGKSGAVFNLEKLTWLNFQHLSRKTDAEVLAMVRAERGEITANVDDAYLLKAISSMRERMTFVKDLGEKCPYFFGQPAVYDPAVVAKRWKSDTPGHLARLAEAFAGMRGTDKQDFESVLHETALALGVKNGELIHPLRLAVSGVGAGPGLYDILSILGRDESVRRIRTAIERLS